MKVTLDMENLGKLVGDAVEASLDNIIREEVRGMIVKQTQSAAKEIVETIVNEKLEEYVKDYIKTATISVGGGWNSAPKVYSVEEYIKKEISDIMESQKLKTNDRYNPTVTFEDFIKSQFDANVLVKKQLEQFMKKVKDDINNNVNNMFNQTTQAALSSAVMNMLMKSDTFLDMQDSIKRITDGR